MHTNRRKFIRNLAIGTGAIPLLQLPLITVGKDRAEDIPAPDTSRARFNMCGYAAPKLDTVRVGIVGLGNRGTGAVSRLSKIAGLDIKALCDKEPARVSRSQEILRKAGLPAAREHSGDNGWKSMCEAPDIDLIYIVTPWHLHTPMAVYAMQHDKHAATEVPAAVTLEECWQLTDVSEKTKKHCMMLENCCYDFFEMLTLNMVREGLFGELVHGEGAYLHCLLESNFAKKGYSDMWRLKENAHRNGSLYPTHGLGPVAQCMNINRGEKMDYLISLSSKDFQMGPKAAELSQKDPFYNEYTKSKFRGNMNTTVIRTDGGKSMMIKHDVTTAQPYSRIHALNGTKAAALKYPGPARIAFGEEWVSEAEMKTLTEKYTPQLIRHIGEIAKKVGGHGGMDFVMDWRLIDCLRNGLPLDMDVYDAALWSAVAPLSETSVANRSRPVDVPDFTRGNWKNNKPVNLTLEGATTGVREAAPAGNQLKVE